MLDLWKMKHPYYEQQEEFWQKFRYTYLGGQRFVIQYLQKFSKRESDPDFATRKSVTYCPSFAASAINDIKNSIYQRMAEISRLGGDKTYQEAIQGLNGGVNLKGASMNNFIGQLALPELLTMGRVGIYIDMPPVDGELLSDLMGKRPYLYIYTAEQIPCWSSIYVNGEEILLSVLLHETRDVTESETGLVIGTEDIARLVTLTADGVEVKFYKQEIEQSTGNSQSVQVGDTKLLKGMKRIPFIVSQITHSLLKDIADYQVALLNMESADVAYVLRANFPFYYEFFDPRAQTPYIPTTPNGDLDGQAAQVAAETSKQQEINVGTMSGRRVPVAGQAPGFIHPSSEPLKASMEKQRQMKNDMRQLINLALGTIEPKFASAESKSMDDRSLEAGLSYIGLELERVERLIGEAWAAYMPGSKAPTIKYPRKYSLKSDADRREDATQYADLSTKAPSRTCAKEIMKLMARTLLEQKVDDETLSKIFKEIDEAQYISSDYQAIVADVEAGLTDLVTASDARGYDGKKVVPLAKKEHEERLARIAESQAAANPQNDNPAARGNPDASPGGKKDAKKEKKNSQRNLDQQTGNTGSRQTRGPNK